MVTAPLWYGRAVAGRAVDQGAGAEPQRVRDATARDLPEGFWTGIRGDG